VGTDVREFLLDGGDANGSNRIFAVDLRQEFIDLGQELFKGPTPGIEFRCANLLDSSDAALNDIQGKVTLLYTGALFHLLEEDEQRVFAMRIKSLLAAEGEVRVFGLHCGAKIKGLRVSIQGKTRFAHDPQSWKELWVAVLGDEAKRWTIKSSLRSTWTTAEHIYEDRPFLQWSLWRK